MQTRIPAAPAARPSPSLVEGAGQRVLRRSTQTSRGDCPSLCGTSTQGWGALLGREQTAGLRLSAQRTRHINELEMEAIRLVISHLSALLWGQVLLVHSDSSTAAWGHQLSVYVSPVPDPESWGLDALSFGWEGMDAYAFPP